VQVVGLTAILLAGAGLYVFATTPAVMLQHRDPHPGSSSAGLSDVLAPFLNTVSEPPAVSPPPAAVAPAGPQVPQRNGLWIEAPALHIALPVVQGDGSDQIPQWVALVYPGTAQPGSAGNSYIYAHGYWQMFGGLLYARVGDAVYLHDYSTGSVVTFKVNRVIGRTNAADVSWIKWQSSSPVLTLQTCTGYSPTSDRFIVQAVKV
jgi:LPXTG-site transpeptidase (sortase) family protein